MKMERMKERRRKKEKRRKRIKIKARQTEIRPSMPMMHSRNLVLLILIDFYRYPFISVIYIGLMDRRSIFQKCEDASSP